MNPAELGKTNFDAYKDCVGGTAYDGKPIPEWEDVDPKIRMAWVQGALAVINREYGARLADIWEADHENNKHR